MFADDTSFTRDFKNVGEIKKHLVPAFSKICRLLNRNKLSLNTVKTEFMIIGTPNSVSKLDGDPSGTPYMIVGASDCRIRSVKLVKCLGLIVYDALTFSNHIDYISTRIKRGTGVMKKTGKFLDKNYLLMLYRTMVETHFRILQCGMGQCNDTLTDRLQIFQNKAARVIAKVKYEMLTTWDLLVNLAVCGLIKLDLGIFRNKSQNNLWPEIAGEFHIPAEMVHSHQTRSGVSRNVFCQDMS